MKSNTIIRSIRFILNIRDEALVDIFKLTDYEITLEKVQNILKKEDDDNFVKCSNLELEHFLDGLITYKRGKQEDKEEKKVERKGLINNNIVFRKLRIAFDLRSEQILKIMKLAKFDLSNSELSAIMRSKDHRNFRKCPNSYIRALLKVLTLKHREIDDNYDDDDE